MESYLYQMFGIYYSVEELSKDIGEDTTVLEVGDLRLGVKSNLASEGQTRACSHSCLLVKIQLIRGSDSERLGALYTERISIFSSLELEG